MPVKQTYHEGFRLSAVQSGQGLGAWVVVRGPVASGQRVVTRGNERLAPGMSVQGELLEYPLP